MKVDLPDPDGPLTATNSPGDTSNDIPRSAYTVVCPRWYVLCRLCTTISGFPWLSALTRRGGATSGAGTAPTASRDEKEDVSSGMFGFIFGMVGFLLLRSTERQP